SNSVTQKLKVIETEQATLNLYILTIIDKYPTDGTYKPLPSNLVATQMGVTKDIYYMNKKIITGDSEKRSYCIGLIFEVYLGACEEFADQMNARGYELPGIDINRIYEF